jgi:hypothetical protein
MSQAPQNDVQERIAAARREADSLKERIRAKRESSADTSRQYSFHLLFSLIELPALQSEPWLPRLTPCRASS